MDELITTSHHAENIEENLRQVLALLAGIVSKSPAAKDDGTLPHDQILNDLKNKLDGLHVSDLAFLLEALPINQRLTLWNCINPLCEANILMKLPDAVRETIIAAMTHDELCIAAKKLNPHEIAYLAPNLPQAVMREVFKSLPIEKREQLRSAMSFPKDRVGSLMNFNTVTIRKDASIETVLRYLRRLKNLPDHTDQLFVVDRDEMFIGTLPLNKLLVNEPAAKVAELMDTDSFTLRPDDKIQILAQAFERYFFVSVPVIDDDGKLLGRVPVNTMVDFIAAKSEKAFLNFSGLLVKEDLFASIWKSAKNRWIWLSLNLCIAFIASRVIGNVVGTTGEETLGEFVELATLIPIVAIISSSAANQTRTIIIRNLQSGFDNQDSTSRSLKKELAISLINGAVWGSLASFFVYLVYKNLLLCMVLFGTLLVSQLFGALLAVLIPVAMHKIDRDSSAFSSSILIATISTCGSLFIFFELAGIFLVK